MRKYLLSFTATSIIEALRRGRLRWTSPKKFINSVFLLYKCTSETRSWNSGSANDTTAESFLSLSSPGRWPRQKPVHHHRSMDRRPEASTSFSLWSLGHFEILTVQCTSPRPRGWHFTARIHISNETSLGQPIKKNKVWTCSIDYFVLTLIK